MTFRRIDYLEWARAHMGRVRYDLARSNVKGLTREEIGLALEDVALEGTDADGLPALRDLLAKRYKVGRGNVLLTSGATMGLWLSCAAVLQEGDQVLVEQPAYEPLVRAAEARGALVRPLERRFAHGFQIELEVLERDITRSTRALVLSNLHNPSGVATAAEKMQSIGQLAKDHGATVIVSEVYLDNAFVDGLAPAAAFGPHMVSIGSLSKVYGLGGLRIGWLIASEDVVARARQALDYIECDLPAPSEAIALVALRRMDEWAERARRIARRGFDVVKEWLAKREDLAWVEPAGGTVCAIRLPTGIPAPELATVLREKHATLVAPGEFFGLRGFLRVSVGQDEDVLRAGLKNIARAIDAWQR